jgi:hypothetical protein
MRVLGAVLMGAAILGGCGGEVGSSLIASPSGDPSFPPSIPPLIARPFAADGQIHVQSTGKIVIRPDTVVCNAARGQGEGHFGINSDELFAPLGQKKYGSKGSGRYGADRQYGLSDPECLTKGAVIINGVQSNNRDGAPYKLVLAVWQGDPAKGGAYWVGGVERLDRLRPDLPPAPPSQPKIENDPRETWGRSPLARLRVSVGRDIKELGSMFTNFVTGALK